VLARARAAGIPVFQIMHDAGQGSPYDVTAEIGQISDEVAPIAGEPVIVKHYPSSFFETDLADQLAKTGRHDLVLTGFIKVAAWIPRPSGRGGNAAPPLACQLIHDM